MTRLHTDDLLSNAHIADRKLIEADLAITKMALEATNSRYERRLALVTEYETNIEKYFFKSSLARDCRRVENTGMPTKNYLVKSQRCYSEYFGHIEMCLKVLQNQFGSYTVGEYGVEFSPNTPQAAMDTYDKHLAASEDCISRAEKLDAEYESPATNSNPQSQTPSEPSS